MLRFQRKEDRYLRGCSEKMKLFSNSLFFCHYLKEVYDERISKIKRTGT